MERWLNMDRRIIFAILTVAIVAATLWPFGQTFQPSKLVQAVYEKVERLPEGSAVMIVTDFDPQAKAELYPMTLVLLKHCFRKNHRVIGLTYWPQGATMGQDLFEQAAQEHPIYFGPTDVKAPLSLAGRIQQSAEPLSKYMNERLSDHTRVLLSKFDNAESASPELAQALASEMNRVVIAKRLYDPDRFKHVSLSKPIREQLKHDPKDVELKRVNRRLLVEAYPNELAPMQEDAVKKSGRDYVYLGWKPMNLPALITNLGENITSTFDRDLAGESTAGMLALEGVPTLKEIALIIDIAAGATVEPWIVYGGDKYRVPMAGGCTAVVAPDLYPFVHSKQLLGLIGGLRGAADYETLLDEPAGAAQGMAAQSTSHSIIIAFVILGNVLFFMSTRNKRQGAAVDAH